VSHDQRAGHTAHPGTHPRGYRRFFGRPSGSIGVRLGGAWKAWLRIAALVLILGLFMLLEEQVLSSASVSHLVRHPSLVGVVDGSHPPVLNLFCSNKRFLRDFRASGLPCRSRIAASEHPIGRCGAVENRLQGPRCRALPQNSLRRGSFSAEILAWRPGRGGIIPHGKDLLRTKAMRATALNTRAAVIGLSGGGGL